MSFCRIIRRVVKKNLFLTNVLMGIDRLDVTLPICRYRYRYRLLLSKLTFHCYRILFDFFVRCLFVFSLLQLTRKTCKRLMTMRPIRIITLSKCLPYSMLNMAAFSCVRQKKSVFDCKNSKNTHPQKIYFCTHKLK